MKDVLIIGAGPSGLMAAYAAQQSGWTPTLFDPDPKPMDGLTAGVFYLHDPCGLELESCEVVTSGQGGTVDDYRRKLYGPGSMANVSFPAHAYTSTAWNGMQAMRILWERFVPRVNLIGVRGWAGPNMSVLSEAQRWSRVINTAPLDKLLPLWTWPHQLVAVVMGSADELDESDRWPTILYDASPAVPWYRYSLLFGVYCEELVPGNIPVYPYRMVKKVLSAPRLPVCPPNVLLAGRYGAWCKKTLTHHVFYQVKDWLSDAT